MTSELDKTLQILKREEHTRVGHRADERAARVYSDIQKQNEELAKKYNLTLEVLSELLSDHDRWLSFLESRDNVQHGETQINSVPLNPKTKRSHVTSHVTGTIFNTTKWDSFFNPEKRKGG